VTPHGSDATTLLAAADKRVAELEVAAEVGAVQVASS
jgi:hypothetical protein